MKIANPIIVALDTPELNTAVYLAKSLKDHVGMVKLGLEFFTANGIPGVEKILNLGVPIFLDLKLHDIPNTVTKTIKVISSIGVDMLTIHLSGGAQMVEEAYAIAQGKIALIGVTVLTSMKSNDLTSIGINHDTETQVHILATLAHKIGIDGIVCSALEAQYIKETFKDKLTVIVPGIRLDDKPKNDDQKRIKTPKQALAMGADYLVIGRPITCSDDPVAAAEYILNSCVGI